MLSTRARFFLAFALAYSWVADVAAAPVERFIELAIHPSDPKVLVLRYENGGGGLIYSNDAGRTFRLLCTSVIDPNMRTAGKIAVTGDGRVLMGMYEGMWQDDGRGCGWGQVPTLERAWVRDIQPHPSDPNVAFALISPSSASPTGGIVRRDANGQWSDIGPREGALVTRLLTVKTANGLRFYESMVSTPEMSVDGTAPVSTYTIRVSDDGANWEEFPIAAMAEESPTLEAVDPSNPDRIVVLTNQYGTSARLLVSNDRGRSFTDYLTVSGLGGIAFAPDGRVWIGEPPSVSSGDLSKGLWFSQSLASPPTKVAEYGVECVHYQPATETLYVCQAFTFGTADQTSGAFEQLFKFAEMKDFLACDGIDMPSTCQAQLCKDYCGAGHFAQAPLCCVYEDPLCGPAVAESEGTGTRAACDAVSAGAAAGTAGAPGNAGATAGTAGGDVENAGRSGSVAPATTPNSSASPSTAANRDSGCGCSLTGRRAPSAAWPFALATLVAMVCRARRCATAKRRRG